MAEYRVIRPEIKRVLGDVCKEHHTKECIELLNKRWDGILTNKDRMKIKRFWKRAEDERKKVLSEL
jgi:hypothetical protein